MFISQIGIDLIKKFEGCSLRSYDDGTGTYTIGYGHTNYVKPFQEISSSQADEYLLSDLKTFCALVNYAIDNKIISFSVNQNQFDSLVSFTFNLGYSNLKQLVEGRNANEVAEHITLYVYAKGKILEGLVKRRQAEKELFLTPINNIERVIDNMDIKILQIWLNNNGFRDENNNLLVVDGKEGTHTIYAKNKAKILLNYILK